jgi:N-6 DNA Methylase
MSAITDWREALAIQRHGAILLSSLQELRDASSSLTARHAVEIAWKQMKLDGVISLGDAPVAYVRRVKEYDSEVETDLHRLHWLNSTAPLLFVVDDASLRTYSARPRQPGKLQGKHACVQVLDFVSDALEVQYLLEHVRTGAFFHQHKDQFQSHNGSDRRLLDQLRNTRNALWAIDKSIDLAEYHALLVRVLFLRYLQDRRILDQDFFGSYLGEEASDLFDYLKTNKERPQQALSRIFSELAHRLGIRELEDTSRTFVNGPFTENHFDLISRFLRDDDVESGQLTLGNWKYDLSLLPVELISAVYQEFIYDEVPTAQRDLGLVPTPRFLAEVVLSLAFEGLPAANPRVLDPACGSGIFLVGCFNRLAHEWRKRKENAKAPALKTYRALKNLLSQSLVGVELKETACELARLNLLHALLNQVRDQSLRTIMSHADTEPGTLLPATSIHAKSFFDPELELKHHSFDLVVGNPPWSKGKNPGWKERYPNRPCPERGNLVYSFCWEVGDYLTKSGHACLLLDGKAMLFAPPARHFAKAWFRASSVDLIVDLTAFRAVLFRGAGRTAAIFRFRPSDDGMPPTIKYVTPWATGVTSHGGLMDLSDAKTEVLRASEVRRWADKGDLPRFFRPRLYGTSRDQGLIERLCSLGTLEEDNWEVHQGFNRRGTNNAPVHRELVQQIPFLPTSQPKERSIWGGWLPVTGFTRSYGGDPNETPMIRQWPIDERVFTNLRVVLHHTPLRSPPMIRAAYTNARFTFHKEILAIYSENATADDARLLAGILMSELAYYIFFHTSLSWGVEAMPQLRQDDIKRFPWRKPVTQEQVSMAKMIIDQIKLLENLGNDYSEKLEIVRCRVSKLVLDYYGLNEWDRDLVRDCIATISDIAFHGGRESTSVNLAARDECLAYVERFAKALQAWSPNQEPIGGTAFISREAQLGVVLLQRNVGTAPEYEALEDDDELSRVLGRLKEILRNYQHPGASANLMVISGNDLYITKPLGIRHWTRSAALNDADALTASLIQRRH